MPLLRAAPLVCLLIVGTSCASRGPAARMYQAGRKAEKKGEVGKAYLLYSKAAALAPEETLYWQRSQAVRSRAALQLKLTPPAGPAVALEDEPEAPEPVTEAELFEARKPQPPNELTAPDVLKDFNLRGNAKSVFEQVARAYGLDCVFDGDYPDGQPTTIRLEQADYREALRALQAATSSFIIPLSDRVFMVAKDTQQKRADLEPSVTVTIPIPAPVTVQEAQELARSVQQVMEIRRFGIDNLRRLVVLSDRISKIRPAQRLFEELLSYRSEVAVELEFLEVSHSDTTSFGLDLPAKFPVNWIKPGGALAGLTGYMFTIGGGSTLFAIGIPDPSIIARTSKSTARSLLRTVIRSGDGLPASFHVGDKYPILTGGYFGPPEFSQGGQVYTPPPQFNFEDLGLVIKVTPKVHGSEEISLDVEAEFKVLTAVVFNGIPVISTRKLASKVRVKAGQWAAVAGMMTSSEARTISGIAGLTQIPGLNVLTRRWSNTKDDRDVLILMKPILVSPPATESVTKPIWVGPEGRLNIPL